RGRPGAVINHASVRKKIIPARHRGGRHCTGTTGVRSGSFARFRFASAFARICARQLGKTVGLSLATLNVDRSDILISVDTPRQLSLSVSLSDDATFENFYAPPTSHNRQVVAALRDQLDDGVDSTFLFLC